jgi:solute carrier family 25 S-adenosylmethionine transporter 26
LYICFFGVSYSNVRPFTDNLQAGGIAAFSVDLLVYPLDTLKTRFQSRDYKKLYYDRAKNAVNRAVLFRGLYQGVGSVILVTIPSCTFLECGG